MPTFQYDAINSVGQNVKGEVEAGGAEEAVTKIRGLGHFPTNVREHTARRKGRAATGAKATTAARPAKQRNVGRVPKKLLTQFTRQLSTLQDAGLPILRSLRILEEQQKPGMLRLGIRLVADDVESGATLSEAMARRPKAFDRLYTNMVQAGEAGGVLDVILQRLSEFMEKSQALRRKIVGAMIYPIAVISFATLIVMGIMIVVIPRFKKIFRDFGTELPAVTELLLGISDWLVVDWGWAVILAIPLCIYLGIKLLKQSASGRYWVDKALLGMPIMGKIVAKTSVSRFTRTLGTLLAAGVPILEALKITRETAGNDVFAQALARVHDAIREGESFAEPLRQARVVEPMVVNMIDVGEETGDLDKMLMKVADTYDDEVDTLVASLVSLLEPVMVIVLGTIVGFIVIALFMPLVELIKSLQQGS